MKKCCVLVLSLFLSISLYAQQAKYKGVVKDPDGNTIPGVTVYVKNTGTGTATIDDGSFTLSASENDVVMFSFVGFESVEITLGTRTELEITLKPDATTLDETVVIGYGSLKKSSLTAAVTSVKSEDLVKTSITSVDQGLQGRAAGVVVMNTSGQPGAATSIRIRGTSSVMGTNEPLYVVDGVPIVGGGASAGSFNSPGLNPMASINPNDVESIEILKDASATAIYGARGANGVILITTKRGSKGKVKTSFDAYFGVQQISKKMDMLNAIQLAELGNEASDNAGVDRNPVFASINNLRKHSTNWQDEIFRIAPIQNYEIGFSGGGEKSTYFLSGGFFSQDGIIIGSDYKKGNIRFNVDQEITSRIKVGTTSNFTYSHSNSVVTNYEGAFASSIASWALEMNPGLPVKNADGTYVYENNIAKPAVGNPVQDAEENEQVTKSARFIGNVYGELKIFDELSFKTSFGIDYYNVKEQGFIQNYVKRGESNNGFASIGNGNGYTWVWENTLSYNKVFNKKHTVNAVAGITSQKFEGESLVVAVADFEDGRLGFHAIQQGAKKQMTNTAYSGWQMLSYLARVNYDYNGKYIATVTARVDGSSKFGSKYKYGFFPSASAAWNIAREDFMQSLNNLSNLKLRASYGIVGNEGIAPYSSQGLLQPTEAYIGDTEIIKGQGPYTIDNKDLKWETTAQFNLGLDAGIFNNRYSLTFDYYIKKTSDLLLLVVVPAHTGYDAAMRNVGSLENKGFEITLNTVPIANNKFVWESNLAFGYNRNKVTDLAGATESLRGTTIIGVSDWTEVKEGKPIGAFYGYQTNGIVQLGEDLSSIPYFADGVGITYGDRKYVNHDDSDNILDSKDKIELGNANPDFTYGWNNTFSYDFGSKGGGLSLNIYLQGVYGNEIANFNLFSLESFDGTKNNSTVALNRWTKDNPSNKYPRANAKTYPNRFSSHQVEDGSYLRIKDITLAYDLPSAWLDKVSFSKIQFYISAKNLYTFTDYSGFDPEVSRFGTNNLSMGADYGSYPMPRLFMIGLRANF
jgi:TonB-linked SusC/RagA family outer membrane protein